MPALAQYPPQVRHVVPLVLSRPLNQTEERDTQGELVEAFDTIWNMCRQPIEHLFPIAGVEDTVAQEWTGAEDRDDPLLLSSDEPIVFQARVILVDDPPLFLSDREEE